MLFEAFQESVAPAEKDPFKGVPDDKNLLLIELLYEKFLEHNFPWVESNFSIYLRIIDFDEFFNEDKII